MSKMDVRTNKWKEELSQSREGRMRERGEVMLGRERVEGDRSIPECEFCRRREKGGVLDSIWQL